MNLTNFTISLVNTQKIINKTTCIVSETEWFRIYDNRLLIVISILLVIMSFLFIMVFNDKYKQETTEFYIFGILFSFILLMFNIFILIYTLNYVLFIPFICYIIYFVYITAKSIALLKV